MSRHWGMQPRERPGRSDEKRERQLEHSKWLLLVIVTLLLVIEIVLIVRG